MKQLLGITCIIIGLAACSTTTTQQPADIHIAKKPPALKPVTCKTVPKDPINVSIFSNGLQPQTHYKVLGLEYVSKYNRVGIKRQEACIFNTMRNLAASMGGDAVIDLKNNKEIVTGKVILFDNKSLA